MQFKIAVFTAALATLAVATPAPRAAPKCKAGSGSLQCCTQVESAANLGVFGALGGSTGNVGVGCVPSTGSACPTGTQDACCQGSSLIPAGILASNPTPVSLNCVAPK